MKGDVVSVAEGAEEAEGAEDSREQELLMC